MYNIPNLKYKTNLCHNWLEGNLFIKLGTTCEKGPNCYFAHGDSELRKIQENQLIIATRNQIYLQYQPSNNFKTVYCRFFAKGQCKLGANCTFAHQKKQKRKNIKRNHIPPPPPMLNYQTYSVPYFYPPFQNYPTQYFSTQMMQYAGNLQFNQLNEEESSEKFQKNKIEIKSEQKRHSSKREVSTTEKQKNDIDKNDIDKNEESLEMQISKISLNN